MNRFQEKAQALIKRTVGQMLGDDKLVVEGLELERHAEGHKERKSTDAKAPEAEGR